MKYKTGTISDDLNASEIVNPIMMIREAVDEAFKFLSKKYDEGKKNLENAIGKKIAEFDEYLTD